MSEEFKHRCERFKWRRDRSSQLWYCCLPMSRIWASLRLVPDRRIPTLPRAVRGNRCGLVSLMSLSAPRPNCRLIGCLCVLRGWRSRENRGTRRRRWPALPFNWKCYLEQEWTLIAGYSAAKKHTFRQLTEHQVPLLLEVQMMSWNTGPLNKSTQKINKEQTA